MFWPVSRDAALDRFLARALVLWILVRLAFLAIFLSAQVGGITPVPVPSPIGVILLCGVVGLIDIRRRGERALWANLGTSSQTLFLAGCGAAGVGEVILRLVRR